MIDRRRREGEGSERGGEGEKEEGEWQIERGGEGERRVLKEGEW